MKKTNTFIADCLYKLADILEAGGHNPYRARAYRRAARTLTNLDKEVTTLLQTDFDMMTLPWIGKGIASTILYIIKQANSPN